MSSSHALLYPCIGYMGYKQSMYLLFRDENDRLKFHILVGKGKWSFCSHPSEQFKFNLLQ